MTPSQFHCATVPDSPNGGWEGGEYRRVEDKNKAALKAAEEMEIEANGYFTEPEWREFISPDACLRYHGRSRVTRFRDVVKPEQHSLPPIPDDLSIPEFLSRRPHENQMRKAA